MPIKPENRAKYPADWKEIRTRILARAENRCERCGVQNGADYCRLVEHPEVALPLSVASMVRGAQAGPPVRIVLTIAHLDSDLVDHSDANLQALCQRCHNLLDAPTRARHAAETRAAHRRQPCLFAEDAPC